MSQSEDAASAGSTTAVADENSPTEVPIRSTPITDNDRARLASGALAGTAILFVIMIVGVTASTGHALDTSLTFALYLLAGAIPLLVGCLLFTFGDGLDWFKIIAFILGGLAVVVALGAILWHIDRAAAVIYIVVTVLVDIGASIEAIVTLRPDAKTQKK